MVEAKVETRKEFDSLTDNLDISMNFTGTGSKPRPLVANPKIELIGNIRSRPIGRMR